MNKKYLISILTVLFLFCFSFSTYACDARCLQIKSLQIKIQEIQQEIQRLMILILSNLTSQIEEIQEKIKQQTSTTTSTSSIPVSNCKWPMACP